MYFVKKQNTETNAYPNVYFTNKPYLAKTSNKEIYRHDKPYTCTGNIKRKSCLFQKYDMLLCICTSCVTLIDALSTWHHTQIMSLLDYFSKESQGDLVVLSRVPDLKFMSGNVCITF